MEVQINGATFKVIDFERRSVLNDDYLRKLIRATGADRVVPMDGEGNDAYLVRLQVCLQDSLRTADFVAGILLPPEKGESDFSVEGAKVIAALVAKANTAEDRRIVHELAMKACLDFFREGLSLLSDFPIFSGAGNAAADAQSATPALQA